MKRLATRLAIASICAYLAGCGGDSSNHESPPATTSVVSIGTITGFGSVIVNGIRFDDSGATITVNDLAATTDQLMIGMVVEVEGSAQACPNSDVGVCDGVASRIRFRNNLEGPITTINRLTNTLQVMGRDITVDDSTVYAGTTAADLDGLNVGDMVSVSGLPEQTRLRARLIQRTGSFQSGATPIMLHGVVAQVDMGLGTCKVDGVTVRFQGLPASDLPAGGLANGQYIQAQGKGFENGVMAADRIQLRERISYPDASTVELEGFVSNFVSVADFSVGGQRVDASSALFRNGVPTDLKDGIKVEVEGLMAGTLLVAKKVIFRQEVNAQIVAPIQSKDTARTALVQLGQTVLTTPLTQFLDSSGAGGRAVPGLTYQDLAIADRVDVRAYRNSDGVLVAMRVERTDPDPVLITKGPVEAKLPLTSFKVLGIDVATGPATHYRDTSGNLINDVAFYDLLLLPPAATTIVRAQGEASAGSLSMIDATRSVSSRGEVEIAH
jgi:Domain of unknown function (DUF5666)